MSPLCGRALLMITRVNIRTMTVLVVEVSDSTLALDRSKRLRCTLAPASKTTGSSTCRYGVLEVQLPACRLWPISRWDTTTGASRAWFLNRDGRTARPAGRGDRHQEPNAAIISSVFKEISEKYCNAMTQTNQHVPVNPNATSEARALLEQIYHDVGAFALGGAA